MGIEVLNNAFHSLLVMHSREAFGQWYTVTFNIYTVHMYIKYILLKKKTYVNLESALKTHL